MAFLCTVGFCHQRLYAQDFQTKLMIIRENLSKYHGYKIGSADQTLKPTNLELFEKPAKFIINGGREGYVLSPAGTGKTVGISHFLQGSIGGTNYKAFVVVPYTPLLEQTKNEIVSKTHFSSSQIGIYGDNKKDLSGQITIITERSLKNLVAEKSIDPNDYPVIILDEADLNWVTELGKETIDYFGKSIHLGYTATEGNIGQLLHNEIWRLEIGEAIEERGLLASNKSILVNVDLVDVASADRGSSYDQKMLGTLVLAHEEVIRDIGGTILKELTQDFTIPFIANFAGIDDAKKGAEILRSIGAPIDAIYSGDEDRNTTIENFEQRGTGGLTNVRVVSRGYNNKKIAVVINFAPTLSESIAIQRNRGTRFDEDNPKKLNIVIDLIYRNTLRDKNGKLKQQLYSAVAKKSQLFNKVVSQLDRSRIEKSVEEKMERVRKILAKNLVLAKQVKVFSQATEVATITNRIANPVRKLTYDQNAEAIRIWNENVRIGQLEKYVGKQYYGMLTQEIMREQKALGQSMTSITQDLYSISGNMSYLRSRKVYGEDHGWLQLSDLVNAVEFKQLSPFYNGRWPKYTGKDYSAREEVQFIVANWNDLISKNLLFQSFDEILDDETLEILKEKSSDDLLIIESADYAQIHKVLGKEQGWPTLVDIGGTAEFNKLVVSLGRVWVRKNAIVSETDKDSQSLMELKSIETQQVTIKNFAQLADRIRNWNMAIENDQLELVTSKTIALKVKKSPLDYLVRSYDTLKNAYDLFGKGNHWSTPDDFINSKEFAKLGADDETRWEKVLTKSARSYIAKILQAQQELPQQKEVGSNEKFAPAPRQNYIPGVHAPFVRHGLKYGNWREILDAIPNEKIGPDKIAKIAEIVVDELRKSPTIEARRTLLALLQLLYKHENMGERTMSGSIVDLFRYNNFLGELTDPRFDIGSREFAKSVNNLAVQVASKQKGNQVYSVELRENVRLDEVAREGLLDFLIRTGKLSVDSADRVIISAMEDYGTDISKNIKQFCEVRATGKQALALISLQKDDWKQVQKILTEEFPITSPWIANPIARQAYLKNQLQIVDIIVAQPGFSDGDFLLQQATDRRNRNDILKFLSLSSVDESALKYVKVYYHNDKKIIDQVQTEMIRREVLRDNTFIVDVSRYKFVQRYNQTHPHIESYSDFERAIKDLDMMSPEESLEILSDQRDLFVRSAYLHDRYVKVKKLSSIQTPTELRVYWGKVEYSNSQLFDYDLIRHLLIKANILSDQARSVFTNKDTNVFANELVKLASGKSSDDDQAPNRNFRDEADWGGREYWKKITQPWLQLNEGLPEDGYIKSEQFGSGFGRGNDALMSNGGGSGSSSNLSDEEQLEIAMNELSEGHLDEVAQLMRSAASNSLLFSMILPEALSESHWNIIDSALANSNYAGENYFLILSKAIDEKQWNTIRLALQEFTLQNALIGIEDSAKRNIPPSQLTPERLKQVTETNILGVMRIFGSITRATSSIEDKNLQSDLKDLVNRGEVSVNKFLLALSQPKAAPISGDYEEKINQSIAEANLSEFQSAWKEAGSDKYNPYLQYNGKLLWKILSDAYIAEILKIARDHREDYLNYRDRHTGMEHSADITPDERGTIRQWIKTTGSGFIPQVDLAKFQAFEQMVYAIVSKEGADKFFDANVDLEGTKFFVHAAQYDHIEDINSFEKWVDATTLQRAFKMAATTGSRQTIELLLHDPRIDEDTLQSAVAIAYEKSDPTSVQIQQILWKEYEKRTGSEDISSISGGGANSSELHFDSEFPSSGKRFTTKVFQSVLVPEDLQQIQNIADQTRDYQTMVIHLQDLDKTIKASHTNLSSAELETLQVSYKNELNKSKSLEKTLLHSTAEIFKKYGFTVSQISIVNQEILFLKPGDNLKLSSELRKYSYKNDLLYAPALSIHRSAGYLPFLKKIMISPVNFDSILSGIASIPLKHELDHYVTNMNPFAPEITLFTQSFSDIVDANLYPGYHASLSVDEMKTYLGTLHDLSLLISNEKSQPIVLELIKDQSFASSILKNLTDKIIKYNDLVAKELEKDGTLNKIISDNLLLLKPVAVSNVQISTLTNKIRDSKFVIAKIKSKMFTYSGPFQSKEIHDKLVKLLESEDQTLRDEIKSDLKRVILQRVLNTTNIAQYLHQASSEILQATLNVQDQLHESGESHDQVADANLKSVEQAQVTIRNIFTAVRNDPARFQNIASGNEIYKNESQNLGLSVNEKSDSKKQTEDNSGNLYSGRGKLFEKYMKDSPGLFNEFYSWMSNWWSSKTPESTSTISTTADEKLTDLQVTERIEGLRDFITRWNRLSPEQRIIVYGQRVSGISNTIITTFEQVKKYFGKFDPKDWGGATPAEIEDWFKHGQIPNEIFKRAGGESLQDIASYVVTRSNLYSLYPISKDTQLNNNSTLLTKDEYIKRVSQAIQTLDYENLKSAWDNFGDEKHNPYLSLNRKTLWEMLGDQFVSLLSHNNHESVQHVLSSNLNLRRTTDEMKRTQNYLETYDIDVVSAGNIKRYVALKKMIELMLPERFANDLLKNLSVIAVYPEGGYVQAASQGDMKTVDELTKWMSADAVGRAFGMAAVGKQRLILDLLVNDPRINDSAYRVAAEGLGIKSTKGDIQNLKVAVADLIKKIPAVINIETTSATEVRRVAFAQKNASNPEDQFYYQKFVTKLDLNQDLRNNLSDLFEDNPDLAQKTTENLKKKYFAEEKKVIYQAYIDILKHLYDRSIHLDSNYDGLKKHFREMAPLMDLETYGDATKYEIVDALSKEGKNEKFKGEVTNYFKNLLGFKKMPNKIDMTKLGYNENKIKGREILDILYTKDVVDRVISQHTFYNIQKTDIIKPIKYGSYDLPALKHPNLSKVLDELSRMNTKLVVDSFLLTDFDAGYYSRLSNPLMNIQQDVIIVSMTMPYYVLMHEVSHLELERAAQRAQMFLIDDHTSLNGLLDALIRNNAIGGDPQEIDSMDQYKEFKSKYPGEFKLLMHARKLYESGLGNLYGMEDINETMAFEKETIEFDKAGLPADHPDRLRVLLYMIDFQIDGLKKQLVAKNITQQQQILLDRLTKDRIDLIEKYKPVYQKLKNNRLDIREFADVESMLNQHNIEQKDRPDLQIHNRSDYDRIGPDFGYPKLETLTQFVHQDSQEQFKKDVVAYSSDPSNYKVVKNGFSLDWIPKDSWAGQAIDKMNGLVLSASAAANQAISNALSSLSTRKSSSLTVVPDPNADQIQDSKKRLSAIADELSHSAKDADELKKGIRFHQDEVSRLTKILEKTDGGRMAVASYDQEIKDFQSQTVIVQNEPTKKPTVVHWSDLQDKNEMTDLTTPGSGKTGNREYRNSNGLKAPTMADIVRGSTSDDDPSMRKLKSQVRIHSR